MAESKFLKYQDKTGDGLIDVCDDFVEVPDPPCPDSACVPNELSLVPNWQVRPGLSPFLNEKICHYQVPVETQYTTTIDERLLAEDNLLEEEADGSLDGRFEEFLPEAITAFLEGYGKDDSVGAQDLMEMAITWDVHTDYFLESRSMSRLRLLYSVPYDILNGLEDAAPESEDDDASASAHEVTYEIAELKTKLIHVRKALKLYSWYNKIYTKQEGGNLYYQAGPAEGAVFPLGDYGDWGIINGSITAKILPQLDSFLNTKGYNIGGVGAVGGFFNRDEVATVTFGFTKEFELEKMTITTKGCSEQPILFKARLGPLKNESAWKDPTAMAYLATLGDMVADLTAREPMGWLEFVKKHTFPEIMSVTNQGYTNTDPQESVGSCVADALSSETKQIGEDILDDVFSIGDAIAYQFHKNLCSDSLDKVVQEWKDIGMVYDPNEDTLIPIEQMAAEQANLAIEGDSQSLSSLCLRMTNATVDNIDDLWTEIFDGLKFCGLTDLALSSIQCLFGGMTFEQAMATVIESALRATSLDSFDKLFVGLPPEKQAELEALAKKKLESGDVFKNSTTLQQTSDVLEGKLDIEKPWDNEEKKEEQERQNEYFQMGDTKVNFLWGEPAADDLTGTDANRRTLAQQFDPVSSSTAKPSNNVLMEAWIQAYIEVYSENYLELLNELNKLPGAPIIAYMIATLDCPQPPIMNPALLDFIQDREFPFCSNTFDVVMPKVVNPMEWYPRARDLTGLLFDTARYVIQQTILKIIMGLMTKICEVMGSAACTTVGATAGALGALASAGREKVVDTITASICGDSVDKEQIDNTVVDMFADMGLGAAALADTSQVLEFAADLSGAVTTEELYNAFLCDVSPAFAQIVLQIVKYEYPAFEPILNNEEAVKRFFCNMGNLMPEDFKSQMSDFMESLPEGPPQPAGLCACATPEQVEQFCELRADILGNRATPQQIAQLCEPTPDLGDLANALQGGLPGMPPLLSEPGCDDGILPYEPEEVSSTAVNVMNDMFEQLKVDFATDMLGNGPGQKGWGMINMMLADTMGQPLTAHYRKAFNRRPYVDFYMDQQPPEDTDTGAISDIAGALFPDPPPLQRQKGAFPTKVADWLQDYLAGTISPTFASNNTFQRAIPYTKTLKEAGIETFGSGIDPLRLDDQLLGYNTTFTVEGDNISFVEEARKQTPDLVMDFRDNCKGLQLTPNASGDAYSTSFNLELYLSELVSDDGTSAGARNFGDVIKSQRGDFTQYVPLDTSRIRLVETPNDSAYVGTAIASMVPVVRLPNLIGDPIVIGEDIQEQFTPKNGAESRSIVNNEYVLTPMETVKYEFLSIDNTLNGMNFDNYPLFQEAFRQRSQNMPQLTLLSEILEENGASIAMATLQSQYDSIMSVVLQTFISEVADNDSGFIYGAAFDDLSYEDVEYVIAGDVGGYPAGTNYYDVRIPLDVDDPLYEVLGGERRLFNKDQIMGVSRQQFNIDNSSTSDEETRVFYLDPLTYGGSYVNPPIYIKPLQNKGWLGLVDVMFPEMSPCKPFSTDLIDFKDIQQKIDDAYPTIPEDERLKDDPDCVLELPYNRILDRTAVAGLEGLIAAAIRIYASVSLIRGVPVFTKFLPSLPDVCSGVFASYVIEEMKESFKDPTALFQGPFKDTEFWYAFLEQSVQLYARRVDNGEIITPPQSVLGALSRLNDAQENYVYPDREELREERGDQAGLSRPLKVIAKIRITKLFRLPKKMPSSF